MRTVLFFLVVGVAGSGAGCALGGDDNTKVEGPVGGGVSGTGGAGGVGGNTASPAGCLTDAECVGSMPLTSPMGCAVPWCDAVLGTCRYLTKDEDGDGHANLNCFAVGGGNIEVGDDCDDANPKRYPGSWDGPVGDGHDINGCGDSIDNDCDKITDNAKLNDGTTCICSPNQKQDCSEYPNGAPISWPNGTPLAPCQYGKQTCGSDGKWGPCFGAIVPVAEACDGQDNDCDGQKDEGISWMGVSLGQACHRGIGACYRTGVVTCVVGGTVDCSAAIVAEQSWKHYIDPITNNWDWDCNGTIEYRDPPDKVVPSCDFGNQSPCKALFLNEAECAGKHVIGCSGVCGQPIMKITCNWVITPGGGHTCSIIGSPASTLQDCK